MRIPLFTREELTRAFALILPPDAAARYAGRWFDECADEVDERGRYLWEAWRWPTTEEEWRALGLAHSSRDPDEVHTGGYEMFRGRPVDEKGEFLLRFSDFHLNLVSLVSADLARTIREARGDSAEQATRSRRQMEAIVAVMRE